MLDFLLGLVAIIIKFHFNNSRTTLLPPPPLIFFGRRVALTHLLQLFEMNRPKPVYASILGMGGISKTALGLALLHHQSIRKQFGDLRWFISCEGVVDADGLRSSIAHTLQMNEKILIPSPRKLASSIQATMLLTLDNLETPWDPATHRQSVEELLLQLTDVPVYRSGSP